MRMRYPASAAAAFLLVLASAAAGSPGEITRDRSHIGQPAGNMTGAAETEAARPGDALLERAYHIHRFQGAAAALAAYEAAAAAGSARAMTALAGFHARGEIVERDVHRALEYYYEAALRDDPAAMLALAGAFHRGEGVDRDAQLARFWLVRAAEAGYRPAMEARRRLATR